MRISDNPGVRTSARVALLSVLCLSTPLYGQSRVDSLEAHLDEATGAERLVVLADLVEALHRDDAQRALSYSREAVVLLARHSDVDLARRVWYWKGQAHDRVGHYDSVLVHSERLEAWAAEMGDARSAADGAYLRGLAQRRLGSYEAGLESLGLALEGYERLAELREIDIENGEITELDGHGARR